VGIFRQGPYAINLGRARNLVTLRFVGRSMSSPFLITAPGCDEELARKFHDNAARSLPEQRAGPSSPPARHS